MEVLKLSVFAQFTIIIYFVIIHKWLNISCIESIETNPK